MTIGEAIIILDQFDASFPFFILGERRKAVKLGVEALIFFEKFQKVMSWHQDAILPGETKD